MFGEEKNQDANDDDLHFMQKALLKWRREASTPTLHRHIVIIIIIICVAAMTSCFPSRASAENSEALSHVELHFLSFLDQCKDFSTFNTPPRFFCFFFCVLFCPIRRRRCSVRLLLQLPHPLCCVSGSGESFCCRHCRLKAPEGPNDDGLRTASCGGGRSGDLVPVCDDGRLFTAPERHLPAG